ECKAAAGANRVTEPSGTVEVVPVSTQSRFGLRSAWGLQHILDQTSHGALAIKSALRTPQNLESAQVVGQHVKQRVVSISPSRATADGYVVDVGAYCGRGCRRRYPPQGYAGLTRRTQV